MLFGVIQYNHPILLLLVWAIGCGVNQDNTDESNDADNAPTEADDNNDITSNSSTMVICIMFLMPITILMHL